MTINGYTLAIVFFAATGGFTYGFGFGVFVSSIGQPGFYEYFELDKSSAYTANILGAINALFAFGAAIGALSQGYTSDRLGRRRAIFLAAVLCLVGGALTAGSAAVPMLVAVRLLQGVGLGQCVALAPLYISEVAPARRRALLGRAPAAWRVVRRLHHDAADAGRQAAAQAEFVQIVRQVAHDRAHGLAAAGYWDLLVRRPSWRRRAWLVVFLMFASQSTGVLGIGNYAVLIYESLGLRGGMPILLNAVYTMVGTSCTVAGSYLADRVGRRPLLLAGFPLNALFLLGEALLQRRFLHADPAAAAADSATHAGLAACILFLFLYIVSYDVCIDPVSFVFVAEIWPTALRARGLALAWAAYFLGTLTYTTPAAAAFRAIGWRFYLVFFACNLATTAVLYRWLPETRARTLEEMGDLFGDPVAVRMAADGRALLGADPVLPLAEFERRVDEGTLFAADAETIPDGPVEKV